MTDTDSKIKDNFKEEIDGTMFHSLVFHTGMKEEIRKKIKTKDTRSLRQSDFIRFVLKNRKFGKVVASLVIFTLFLTANFLLDSNTKVPEKSDFKPFQEKNLIENPNTKKVWELVSLEEARELFGNELMLPIYNPSEFTLDRIHLLGESIEKANKLILTYTSGEQIYSITIERDELQNRPLGFGVVDINGVEGYLKQEESIEILDSELHWYRDDLHYMVGGIISSIEAVKIAKSFK